MICLVPQLRCPNDAHLRLYCYHTLQVKAKTSVCFRSHCVSSPMPAVFDIEKLQISSLEDQLTSLAIMRPFTYVGAIGPPTKTNFDRTLDTETLLTGEEAEIAAAAAEAVALARAAASVAKDAAQTSDTERLLIDEETEIAAAAADAVALARAAVSVAKDAAQMIRNDPSLKLERSDDFPYEGELFQLERVGLGEGECVDEDISRLKHELEQMQHFEITAVRSGRQTERRVRRSRATEKASAGVVAVKSGSSGRKKRSSLHEIDYSDPLRYLRGVTSTSKLLTATEELELSEGIQDLLKLERLQEELAERNGGQPTFTQWAEAAGVDQKTLRNRLNYGISCKDKMVKSNIRLVISIAKNYQGVGMNLQDLVQEGCRGLVKGAEKFDASKGFKFSTYAHWWIKQAVRKSLSDQSRTIRLPLHMIDATYRVREARKQLYSENGRHPDNEEVAEATGLSMKRLTAVMLTPKAPGSLDQKVGINQSLKPSEVTADPDAQTAEETLMKQLMKQDLEKVLDSLRPREKQVIRLRFGLEDGRMKTLQEIGELMGVCRERVRQIESSAFRKLKNKKRTHNLSQYIFSLD